MRGDAEDNAYAAILMGFILPSDTLKACNEIIDKLEKQRHEKRKHEITELLGSSATDTATKKILLDELKNLSGRNNK